MGESACVDVEESLGYGIEPERSIAAGPPLGFRTRGSTAVHLRAREAWIRLHRAGERPA